MPRRSKDLTERQKQVRDFIAAFSSTNGYGPSVRDIGKALGINSPNGVMCHIKALRDKNAIADSRGIARGFRATDSITVSRARLSEALRLAEEDGNLACAEVLQELLGKVTA